MKLTQLLSRAADRTLKLLDKIASGETVDIADILGVMEVLKTAKDLHQPVDLDERLRSRVDENEKTYDNEVADSLLQLLAGRNDLVRAARRTIAGRMIRGV